MFDIHGCLDEYGFDMDIGVNGGENVACGWDVVERLAEKWQRQGLDVRVDEKFVARWPRAISNYAHQKTGVNCLQLELSGRTRTTAEGLEKFLDGF